MVLPSITFKDNNVDACIDFCTLKDRKGTVLGCCAKEEDGQLYVNTAKNGFEPNTVPNWQVVKDGQTIMWGLSHFRVENADDDKQPRHFDFINYE